MRTGTLTLRITSALDHVFLVGLSVRGICAGVSLDTAAADAVELCVVEAVNNAIEHAYREQPGQPVEVDVEFESELLRIMVRDRGETMDWAAICARAERSDPEDMLSEGGRGIFIMRSLMDTVTYRSAGGWNTLTLVKRLPDAVIPALNAAR
jgi:serine/threonine-protein kinase RsbW